jgi:deoxycytidine triphosphate deaminase
MKNIASDQNESKLSNVLPQDVQPNAVDLRLDKIFELNHKDFVLDEEKKLHRGSKVLESDEDGYFNLKPGSYEITFQNIVTIAPGEAGFVITRSTLNRNGVFITSGLYDSGYQGVMAGALHVNGGLFRVKKGTRLGQFLLFDAESIKLYDGDYGLNKEHDKKYI